MPKPLKQNKVPAHKIDLHLKDRPQWEAELFDDAVCFTVCRKTGPGKISRMQFADLADAMRNAYYDLRTMLYVVASDDTTFCMPRKEWLSYLLKWKAKKGNTDASTTS